MLGFSLIIAISSAIIFPTPMSSTTGWHPVAFKHEHDLLGKPERVEFVDENYVLWKDLDNKYNMRPDVCPHQGALLSGGTLEDGCIKCSYHGLKVGPSKEAHPMCKQSYGKCKVVQDIIWWAYNKNEDETKIPYCDKLGDTQVIPTARFSTVIEAGFSDCFKNSMDFHHAAFVHKNTFGNYAGEPDLIAERWNTKGELEGNFLYGSNDIYSQYTGGKTDNSHVFCEPSTTYNIVTGKDGKYMIIHVAMRSMEKYKTKWYLTASSNFVPGGTLGQIVLDRMARKVAMDEDGRQLSKMATDEEKDKHSFKFTLPLDTIYAGWNKKYETAEELEGLLDIETDKDKLALIGEKLRAYNHTMDFMPYIRNTDWLMFNCPHLFKGSTIVEIIRDNVASEITQLKNGTIFSAIGRLNKITNSSYLIDRINLKVSHERGSKGVPMFNPFNKHAFEMMYVSKKYLLRKGVETGNWEMMTRINATEECPVSF